jgi:hypothetical protein
MSAIPVARWPYTLRSKKDPAARLDYEISWADWLAPGDRITASIWSIDGGTIEDASVFTDTAAQVWISGGTPGETITLTNEITTTQGRIDQRTLLIRVAER